MLPSKMLPSEMVFDHNHVLCGSRIRVKQKGMGRHAVPIEGLVGGVYWSHMDLVDDQGIRHDFKADEVLKTMTLEVTLHSLSGIEVGTVLHVDSVPNENFREGRNFIATVASINSDGSLTMDNGEIVDVWPKQPQQRVSRVLPKEERIWWQPFRPIRIRK